ncbi:type II toxin-antitoxin system VapC family toxin [Streptomonospora sediminis]
MARRRLAEAGALVLDCEGLRKIAAGNEKARALQVTALRRRARIVVSALTLTETLRGGPRDAAVHLVLSRVVILPVTAEIARCAGELLGATGLSGHRCAIDAVVAATALEQPRPAVLMTSDPDDMNRLVEEPELAKKERVTVAHV